MVLEFAVNALRKVRGEPSMSFAEFYGEIETKSGRMEKGAARSGASDAKGPSVT